MGYDPGSLYYYAPNKGAPIAMAVLFFITASIHLFQIFKYKTPRLTGLLPWAGTLFIAGLIMRELGSRKDQNVTIFIVSTVLLLLAPPVYAGANYFILGRTLYYVPYNAPLHPGRVVSTFIGIDIIIGVLTGNGASIVSNQTITQHRRDTGNALLKAALFLQIASMLAFVTVTFVFQRRCMADRVFTKNVRTVVFTLYASCTLIFIRTVYRTVEYFEVSALSNGQVGKVLQSEVYFYVFDVSLMLINSVMLNVNHPGRFMPRSNKTYLARDGVTELEGPGWVDKRNFLATLFDPFDVVGLITKRDSKEPAFWDQPQASSAKTAEASAAPVHQETV